MSDFLDALAARAVAPVPAIRPAIRSPYEPPLASESNWIEFVTASVPIEATPTARWNPARNPPLARAPEMPASPPVHEQLATLLPSVSPEVSSLPAASGLTSDPPPPRHAIPPPLRAPPKPMTGESKRMLPKAAAAAEPAPAPPSPSTLRPGAVPRTVMAAIAPAELPMPHPGGLIRSVRPGGKSAGKTPRVGSLPAGPTPVLHPAPPSPAAVEEPGLRLSPPRRSPLLAAAISRLPEESPARPASSQAPPPAPEVNITIGRVEIRAAVPAAPAPMVVPRAAGPHLSLDAFLRRNASSPA